MNLGPADVAAKQAREAARREAEEEYRERYRAVRKHHGDPSWETGEDIRRVGESCVHCRQHVLEHAGVKCLFDTTSYEALGFDGAMELWMRSVDHR